MAESRPTRVGRLARHTKICFAENQLSPSLIGLSPLAVSHPRVLQHPRVRPSGARAVSLLTASSPGFGSGPADSRILPAPSKLRLAGGVNLLAHYAKGTLSPKLQLLLPTWGFAPTA